MPTTCCGREAYTGHRAPLSAALHPAAALRPPRATLITFTYCGREGQGRSATMPCLPWGCRTTTSKTSRVFQHLLRYHLQAPEAPQRGDLLSGYPDGIFPGARDAGCGGGRQNDHSALYRTDWLTPAGSKNVVSPAKSAGNTLQNRKEHPMKRFQTNTPCQCPFDAGYVLDHDHEGLMLTAHAWDVESTCGVLRQLHRGRLHLRLRRRRRPLLGRKRTRLLRREPLR